MQEEPPVMEHTCVPLGAATSGRAFYGDAGTLQKKGQLRVAPFHQSFNEEQGSGKTLPAELTSVSWLLTRLAGKEPEESSQSDSRVSQQRRERWASGDSKRKLVRH